LYFVSERAWRRQPGAALLEKAIALLSFFCIVSIYGIWFRSIRYQQRVFIALGFTKGISSFVGTKLAKAFYPHNVPDEQAIADRQVTFSSYVAADI
jgi:hypothetical protein